jgi:acetyl/propionyl-CoA carboxylase alpha subunit
MFSKILVANRGLIQANCIRAIQELGAKAITVYEAEDRHNAGVRNADEAHEIKAAVSGHAYNDIHQIVQIAVARKADAVFSGYGYLAQNAEFLKKLKKKGIFNIGPDMESPSGLGDKQAVKQLAQKLGLAVIPGSDRFTSYKGLSSAAETLGFPLLVKATNSYGGKGLRVVEKPTELNAAFEYVIAQCEKYAMNSCNVYLEKYLPTAHHIEFPVLRDKTGQTAIFPEQWCSVQRRFQKQLVETPSSVISEEKRSKLKGLIQRLVDKLNLVGFVSVIFLIDETDAYFLKASGFVQPFYTGTSLLTGVDLLKEQIRILAGSSLKVKTDHCRGNGHVISVSICAEDPNNHFAPSPGVINRFYLPFGQGINVQTDISSGDTVTASYDPMIAKIIVKDNSRKEAIRKLKLALEDCCIEGIRTNIPLMRALVNSADFVRRKVTLSYIPNPKNRSKIIDGLRTDENLEMAALVAALDLFYNAGHQPIPEASRQNVGASLWQSAARWLSLKKTFL